MTMQPLPLAETISILCPIFSQSFLHRYNPIPVDFFPILPFSPVKPLSQILGRSPAEIPMPVSLRYSFTCSRPFSAYHSRVRSPSPIYLILLERICWRIKASHLLSEKTSTSRSWHCIEIFSSRRSFRFFFSTSDVTFLREIFFST